MSRLNILKIILSVKFVINFSQLKHVSDVNLMPASRGVLNDTVSFLDR